ncbi:hypothetical protein [Reichenbachiella faecimaris]|uniref:hypothetical protein n=1 Tax=Reichenbachiella faecimaris TaxID=692418 RepID=UPI001C88BA11|nr:hypothetical protein [Reichenbachiella faecimaris]
MHIEEKIAQIPSLPGMVILKLVAWNDRPEERENDLSDILRIIQHFYDLEFDDIADHHYDLLATDILDELLVSAEVLGRKCRIYLEKSTTLSDRITGILKNELTINEKSAIARDWARKLDKDVNYASSIIRAFQRGILSKKE